MKPNSWIMSARCLSLSISTDFFSTTTSILLYYPPCCALLDSTRFTSTVWLPSLFKSSCQLQLKNFRELMILTFLSLFKFFYFFSTYFSISILLLSLFSSILFLWIYQHRHINVKSPIFLFPHKTDDASDVHEEEADNSINTSSTLSTVRDVTLLSQKDVDMGETEISSALSGCQMFYYKVNEALAGRVEPDSRYHMFLFSWFVCGLVNSLNSLRAVKTRSPLLHYDLSHVCYNVKRLANCLFYLYLGVPYFSPCLSLSLSLTLFHCLSVSLSPIISLPKPLFRFLSLTPLHSPSLSFSLFTFMCINILSYIFPISF